MSREMQESRDDEVETPVAGLRELRLELEPDRDLWSGIEARIAPRRAGRGVSANAWMGLAAAACVAVVVGLGVLRPLPPAETPATATSVASAASPMPNLQVVPGSRALVKANLQLSRSSEAQIRKALQQDPDSASLRRLLLTTEARSDELRRLLAAQST